MKPRILDLYCGAGGAAAGYANAGFDVVGVDHEPQDNYVGDEFVQADALAFLRGDTSAAVCRENGSGADTAQRAEQVGMDSRTDRLSGPGGTVSDLLNGGGSEAARQGAAWRFNALSFDAIHASPPCQAHSTLKAVTRHIDHPDLVGATRELLEATGLPYVIENVEGAPLHEPLRLCGSSFGLGVRRHRLFECTFPVMAPPCAHGMQPPQFEVFEHGHWRLSRTAPVYGRGGGKSKEHWAEAMGISWMTRDELTQAIPPAMTEHIGSYLLFHLEAERKAAA